MRKKIISKWDQQRMLWTFQNGIFLVFWKLLSDEVKTAFWESEVKCQKLFKSKILSNEAL